MNYKLYDESNKSDDISTERDAEIARLLRIGEYEELQAFLKEGEVLRLAKVELFKIINVFNSSYRQPNIQMLNLKALENDGLTKHEIYGESLKLNFLGAESFVHPIKLFFQPLDDQFINSLNDYDSRNNKCRVNSFKIANNFADESSVLTGFMYGYSNKNKYLHSVVKVNVDGKQGIIDSTINSLMSKELYDKITDFEVVTEIPSSTIKKDFDLVKGKEIDYKNYFLNRDEYIEELRSK